jgi:hypothetical protein
MILTLQPRIAICCAALVFVIAGCASSPTRESDIWEVTPSASFSTNYALNASNSGYIQITRDDGNSGSACTTNVIVDARSAARLRPTERVTVRVPVGEHKVSAEIVGMCPGSTSEQTVLVTPDATKRLRVRYGDLPGVFAILPVD